MLTLRHRQELKGKQEIQLTAKKAKAAIHMYDKIGNLVRLKYVLIAILLFLIGLVLMLTFFLMITIPFALAVWAWAGIFLHLAAIGRPYSDFVAALPSIKHKSRNRSV